MICDETNNYKGELSMAQKQSNTNLSTLLFSFMNQHKSFHFTIQFYESARSDAQHAGMALRADDGGRGFHEVER